MVSPFVVLSFLSFFCVFANVQGARRGEGQGGRARTADRELRALGDELDSCQVCAGVLFVVAHRAYHTAQVHPTGLLSLSVRALADERLCASLVYCRLGVDTTAFLQSPCVVDLSNTCSGHASS